MADTAHITDFDFERGRRLFREGAPEPAKPTGQSWELRPIERQNKLWLGWMAERAITLLPELQND